MGKKRKNSFDEIANKFELDGHDTMVSETKVNNIDNLFKKGKKSIW